MQHVVDGDDASLVQHRMRDLEVAREALAGMRAVDMKKRAGPLSLARKPSGPTAPLSVCQVLTRSSTPLVRQLCRNRSRTPGSGQSNRSIPSALSPVTRPSAMAMKKRPSSGPISTTCPDTPSPVWRR